MNSILVYISRQNISKHKVLALKMSISTLLRFQAIFMCDVIRAACKCAESSRDMTLSLDFNLQFSSLCVSGLSPTFAIVII